MNKKNLRGKKFFANKMHKELFFLVFFAAVLPALITTISLFYFIFYITAEEVGIPEAVAYNIIPAAEKVMGILVVVVPLSILVILVFAHRVTHKIVGPFDRIVRELEESIKGAKQGPIVLRKDDKFWPLVDKINLLISKKNKP